MNQYNHTSFTRTRQNYTSLECSLKKNKGTGILARDKSHISQVNLNNKLNKHIFHVKMLSKLKSLLITSLTQSQIPV